MFVFTHTFYDASENYLFNALSFFTYVYFRPLSTVEYVPTIGHPVPTNYLVEQLSLARAMLHSFPMDVDKGRDACLFPDIPTLTKSAVKDQISVVDKHFVGDEVSLIKNHYIKESYVHHFL